MKTLRTLIFAAACAVALASSAAAMSQDPQTDPNKTGDRKYHLTDGDKILQELAEETGGRSFFPYHVDDLDQSFQDIGDELRNQYSIAYAPNNYILDGRYHKIRIEVPEHKGYQVRARRGYFARANEQPGGDADQPDRLGHRRQHGRPGRRLQL